MAKENKKSIKKSVMYYTVFILSALKIILNMLGLLIYFFGSLQSFSGDYVFGYMLGKTIKNITPLAIIYSLATIILQLVFLNFFVKGDNERSKVTGTIAYMYEAVLSIINLAIIPLFINILVIRYLIGYRLNLTKEININKQN